MVHYDQEMKREQPTFSQLLAERIQSILLDRPTVFFTIRLMKLINQKLPKCRVIPSLVSITKSSSDDSNKARLKPLISIHIVLLGLSAFVQNKFESLDEGDMLSHLLAFLVHIR